MNQESEARAIITAVRELHGHVVITPFGEDKPLAIMPNDLKVVSLRAEVDKYLKVPERKSGKASFTKQSSFTDYVNRHKTGHSVIFLNDSDKNSPRLIAILNAHKAEVATQKEHGDSGADNQDFLATYSYPLSDQWKAWTGAKKDMSQTEFADFVEDHIADITSPNDYVKEYAERIGVQLAQTPASILTLTRNLAVTAEMKVEQKVNRSTGETLLVYSEEHKEQGGGQFKAPGAFALFIPVFKGGVPTTIPVRLRYRLQKNADGSGAKAVWSFAPQEVDDILERQLIDSEELVKQQTGLPVFRGAP